MSFKEGDRIEGMMRYGAILEKVGDKVRNTLGTLENGVFIMQEALRQAERVMEDR